MAIRTRRHVALLVLLALPLASSLGGRDSVTAGTVVEASADGYLTIQSEQSGGPVRYRVRDGIRAQAAGRPSIPVSSLRPGTQISISVRPIGERDLAVTRVYLVGQSPQ
jgi:hypothetical protein